MASHPASSDFGLYIHWPFCLSKCPYCDFNSHVVNEIDEAAWQTAMLAELDIMTELAKSHDIKTDKLRSIFFGGGTPSLMPAAIMENLIAHAQDIFGFASDIEITAEANPTSVETAKMHDFKAAGINRVSLGIQALNDTDLRFLGRGHSADEAISALELANSLFDRVSIDLIYGRAGQSLAEWQTELQTALSFELDHLSLYQLTIEQGTQFYSRARKGEILTCDDDDMAALYEVTGQMAEQAGLNHYEISNYAKTGSESRHNLIYWRGGNWLGIGPGATGRLTTKTGRLETICRKSPAGWLADMQEKNNAIAVQHYDDNAAFLDEIIMMGLRLSEGVPLARLQQNGLAESWPFDAHKVADLTKAGWLVADHEIIKTTKEGKLRLNYILQELLT